MRDILRLSAPLTLWLVAFSAVYGLEGLLCSARAGMVAPEVGRAVLVSASVAAVAAQLGLLLVLRSPGYGSPSRFVRQTSLALAVAATVASAWTLLVPAAVTSLCL
jgi:hypothetical protein